MLVTDVRDVLDRPDLLGGHVDLVLLANVIYYWPVDEREALLRSMAALLQPGGALVLVSTAAAQGLTSRHLDLLLRAQEGGMELPDTAELLGQLRRAGLQPSAPRRIAPDEPLFAIVAEAAPAAAASADDRLPD